MKALVTVADKGLFNGEPYNYRLVQVSKDSDPRMSRKDGWMIRQGNERLYLTTLQMNQLRDILNTLSDECREHNV